MVQKYLEYTPFDIKRTAANLIGAAMLGVIFDSLFSKVLPEVDPVIGNLGIIGGLLIAIVLIVYGFK